MECPVMYSDLLFGLRLLVKQFDARHCLAALGRLDAVSDENASAVDAYRTRKELQDDTGPQSIEVIESHGRTVHVFDQVAIASGHEFERPNDARNAQVFGTHRKSSHGRSKPKERL